MLLNIRVSPKASRNKIKKEGQTFKVYLTKTAHDGLANRQLIELLADYFRVKRYQVKIVRGEKSRDKIIEVETRTPSRN